MSTRTNIKYLILSVLLLCGIFVSAQETRKYHSPEHEFIRAVELFEMEQYGSAKDLFGFVYQQTQETYHPRKQAALYYQCLCAAILYHDDAEQLAFSFAQQYPQYMNLDRIWFHLGDYYFFKKQYKKSLNSYQKIDPRILNPQEIAAYQFKMGYGYFDQAEYDQAKPLFKEVLGSDNLYKNKAVFYYSHILYTEGNYNAALSGFETLKEEEAYNAIVPFYIAHIYFNIGNYDKIIEQKEELLSKSSQRRLSEINGIIAQSYYQKELFVEATPYFEKYINEGSLSDCEAYYMLGYCYYKSEQYQKAITQLTRSICKNDSLNQYAYFLMGDCYLKTAQKEFSSQMFLSAYENNSNEQLSEEALYNYAKLQYELSSNPFVGAIAAFEKYLNLYRSSPRRNEAETFLSSIYLSTKNYRAAIASLEKITNKSTTLLRAYQRVCYYRALEFFNDKNFDESEKYLGIALANNYDPNIYSQSLFWRAEIAYRKGDYQAASDAYSLFSNSANASKVAEYPMSFYNAGYADFKLKRYRNALSKFNSFLDNKNKITNPKMLADAYNRCGDCYFMLSQLEKAKDNYQKNIDLKIYDVDYALFQKAQSEGGLRQHETKAQTMKQLVREYPKSPYIIDAQYEIANSYLADGKTDEAIKSYESFIGNNPRNPLVRAASLKLGSIYYNTEKDEKAIAVYKELVSTFPNSEEAAIALKSIENIYVASGNVDDFFTYVRSVSSEKITISYQDSVTYNAASEKYFSQNFVEAEKGFDTYINRFPSGVFALKANYYKGECAMRRNDFAQAKGAYQYVLGNTSDEQFLLTALHNSAFIFYHDSNYRQAVLYYQQLAEKTHTPSQKTEAHIGMARCYYFLHNYDSAIVIAQELLNDEKAINYKEEVLLIASRSAFSNKNYDLAKKYYTVLSKESKSEANSEALYQLANIEYLNNNLELAEKKIFDILVKISHDYWLAKSYILLGDIYTETGNVFQAKHTYQSIIDNYDGEELVEIAKSKYNALISLEEQKTQGEQTEDIDEN